MSASPEKFGKYEIVRKLSRSMTDVYLARDTWTNQRVVLKKIEHSNDDFTRLVIEAETRGAQIQRQLHQIDPRILEVYEFGEESNCFFVAMEYFEGRTLAEILSTDRRFEPRRAVRYTAEICSQLRTLHSFLSDMNGRKTAVVHGDVKPSNVQIGLIDNLKLLDFGIAKVITATHNLTRHNLGSPSYCSPERLSKGQVDINADLWAVGVTLFEMISGSPPYQAQDTRQLENIIQSKRPPRALPEDCPDRLKAIVAKALAGDINFRYGSAELFENDLRAFLDAKPIAAGRDRITWDANATVDKAAVKPANPTVSLSVRASQQSVVAKPAAAEAPPAPAKSNAGLATRLTVRPPVKTPTVRFHFRRALFSANAAAKLSLALLAGLAAGLLLFIPLGYYYRAYSSLSPLRGNRDYAHEAGELAADWSLYQTQKRKTAFLGAFAPIGLAEHSLRVNLVNAADNIIDNYRGSADTHLGDFDWARARVCLNFALQLDPTDIRNKGKLALCDGYLNLMQNPRRPKADFSVGSFRQASSFLPRSPDPHLGLARLYIYAFHNVAEAMAEFQQAQRLGFQLGPREAAQEADGYLYRSEWELAHARRSAAKNKDEAEKWLQMSRDDIENARKLYEPLVGFANVSSSLEQVYQDRSQQIELEETSLESSAPAPAPAQKPVKHPASTHKWR